MLRWSDDEPSGSDNGDGSGPADGGPESCHEPLLEEGIAHSQCPLQVVYCHRVSSCNYDE